MALPTFVVAGTGAGSTGGVSPALPAAQLGDILILVIEGEGEDGSADNPPDSTWTAIGPGSIASSTDGAADRTRLSAYWAPYSTTVNRSVPDAGDHTIARLYAFRGVNLANPINGSGSGSNATNSTSHSAVTGITTTVNDCMVAIAYGHGDDALSSPGSPTNASLANVASGGEFASDQGSDGTVGLIYGEKATAGAGGTFTWTTSATEENAWIAFALNPATADATLKHDFEGSSDGVDLNSVTTNTSDNNPVVAEYTPGAATAQFDTSQFAHGAASGQFTVASGENAYVIWNAAAVTERFWRLYLRFDDATPTSNTTIVRLENAGTFVGDIQIRTTGALALRDASFTLRYITTTLLSPNTWYRFEFRYVHNATTGHMEGRLFTSIDSPTPAETIGSPSTNWNTGAAVTDMFVGVASNPGQSFTMWVDDFATDPTDWIGPWTGTPATLDGALFTASPSFITGSVQPGNVTITGTLFAASPTFISGLITTSITITGNIFTASPTFISGTISPVYTIVGNLFARPPTLITGSVDVGNVTVAGTLFTASPSYITGSVIAGNVTLSGTVFSAPSTFLTGSLALTEEIQISGFVVNIVYTPAAGGLLNGVLFTRSPSFTSGILFAETTLSGVLFTAAPTFITGTVQAGNVTISGNLFTAPPTFFAGQVTTQYTLDGVLFTRPPSFITGQVSTTYTLNGTLFPNPPSFISGSITAEGVTLNGVLFSRPPTFIAGFVDTGEVFLLGVLFTKSPSFLLGLVQPGNITVTGVLFSKLPSFISGSVTTQYTLDGVLFSKPPSFNSGQITTQSTLVGVLFSRPPTHISGVVLQGGVLIQGFLFSRPPTFISGIITPGNVTVSGVLFSKPPTFFSGVSALDQTISANLFTRSPLFITGTMVLGAIQLSGVLFAKSPTFFAGQVIAGDITIPGVLFSRPPTFFTGTFTLQVSGNIFSTPPTFFSGTITAQATIAGGAFLRPPTFLQGLVGLGFQDLLGGIFNAPPTFPTGQVTLQIFSVPSGLRHPESGERTPITTARTPITTSRTPIPY